MVDLIHILLRNTIKIFVYSTSIYFATIIYRYLVMQFRSIAHEKHQTHCKFTPNCKWYIANIRKMAMSHYCLCLVAIQGPDIFNAYICRHTLCRVFFTGYVACKSVCCTHVSSVIAKFGPDLVYYVRQG